MLVIPKIKKKLINPKKTSKSKYKNSGVLVVACTIEPQPTFLGALPSPRQLAALPLGRVLSLRFHYAAGLVQSTFKAAMKSTSPSLSTLLAATVGTGVARRLLSLPPAAAAHAAFRLDLVHRRSPHAVVAALYEPHAAQPVRTVSLTPSFFPSVAWFS